MRRRSEPVPFRVRAALLVGLALAGAVAAGAQEPEVQPADRMAADADRSLAENEPDDPLAAARELYVAGSGHLRRGDKLAAKAAKATGKEQVELAERARGEHEAAVEALGEAVRSAPGLLDAYVALGAALRAVGRADEAAQVHGMALQRNDGHDGNFRGYVESLLAGHRLGNVAALHDQIQSREPKRAKFVYEALERFYAERAKDAAGLAPEDLERLASWLAERRAR